MGQCVTTPRLSPFTVGLSSPEEAELRAGKYKLLYVQVQHAKKMILCAAEGMPNDEVAARLDAWRPAVKWSPCGESAFSPTASLRLEELARPGRRRSLALVVQVKPGM